MARTLGREVISTRQRKIAELAQREPKLTLTTLAHHVDDVWMREAYRRIRKDAAAGVWCSETRLCCESPVGAILSLARSDSRDYPGPESPDVKASGGRR